MEDYTEDYDNRCDFCGVDRDDCHCGTCLNCGKANGHDNGHKHSCGE